MWQKWKCHANILSTSAHDSTLTHEVATWAFTGTESDWLHLWIAFQPHWELLLSLLRFEPIGFKWRWESHELVGAWLQNPNRNKPGHDDSRQENTTTRRRQVRRFRSQWNIQYVSVRRPGIISQVTALWSQVWWSAHPAKHLNSNIFPFYTQDIKQYRLCLWGQMLKT